MVRASQTRRDRTGATLQLSLWYHTSRSHHTSCLTGPHRAEPDPTIVDRVRPDHLQRARAQSMVFPEHYLTGVDHARPRRSRPDHLFELEISPQCFPSTTTPDWTTTDQVGSDRTTSSSSSSISHLVRGASRALPHRTGPHMTTHWTGPRQTRPEQTGPPPRARARLRTQSMVFPEPRS